LGLGWVRQPKPEPNSKFWVNPKTQPKPDPKIWVNPRTQRKPNPKPNILRPYIHVNYALIVSVKVILFVLW